MNSSATEHARAAMRKAAGRARLAPSIHNTQPWHMRLDGTTLEMSLDPGRQLDVLDPRGRQAWISCGAALLNARVCLAHDEEDIVVTRFPDGVESAVFARLSMAPVAEPDAATAQDHLALAQLEPAIPMRRTNRARFEDTTVPEQFISLLAASARAEGAILTAVRREDQRVALVGLSREADAIEYADPRYRAELRSWTTDDPNRTDGVHSEAIPHVDGNSGDEIPLRDFDTRGAGRLPSRTQSSHRQTLLVLGTDGDSREDWLRVGEALERVLLEIAQHAFSAGPLMQALEVPEIRARLQRELGLNYHPQFLFRVGHGLDGAPTPRRALDDLLDESQV